MAAGMRGGLGFASWVLLGGALVMMFFVILSGVKNSTPLNKTYFLQADLSKVPGAQPTTQWTFFYICGDDNQNCGSAHPALPFGYAWINGTDNVPAELVGSHGSNTTSQYYFYMWRFGWVFYLIGLFFGVLTLFTGILSCTRIGSGLSGMMALVATFFTTLAAILMTVEFVKARDVFNANGMTASLGRYAFGFTWGAVAALFLASLGFFGGCCIGRNKDTTVRSTRRGFFRRNKSTRSRHSFVDTESQRRVKDEY